MTAKWEMNSNSNRFVIEVDRDGTSAFSIFHGDERLGAVAFDAKGFNRVREFVWNIPPAEGPIRVPPVVVENDSDKFTLKIEPDGSGAFTIHHDDKCVGEVAFKWEDFWRLKEFMYGSLLDDETENELGRPWSRFFESMVSGEGDYPEDLQAFYTKEGKVREHG